MKSNIAVFASSDTSVIKVSLVTVHVEEDLLDFPYKFFYFSGLVCMTHWSHFGQLFSVSLFEFQAQVGSLSYFYANPSFLIVPAVRLRTAWTFVINDGICVNQQVCLPRSTSKGYILLYLQGNLGAPLD